MGATREQDVIDHDLAEAEVQADMGVSTRSVRDQSRVKRAVFDVLYAPVTELIILGLILFSVVLLVVEITQPEGQHSGWMSAIDKWEGEDFAPTVLFWLDLGVTLIFVVEYLLKLWVAPDRWLFVRRNWVDLLAILPVLRVFRLSRAVRLLRLLRLLRLARAGAVVQQYVNRFDTVTNRGMENQIIFLYLLFSLVFGSVGVLVFEKGHNDGFQDLGDALWWCVVTITTVGYGDISPVTAGGKVVAGVIMFIGLTFWALLTGTVSSIIIEQAKRSEGESMVIASLTDHVVICGWNATGERLVRDLIVADPDMQVVIVQTDENIDRIVDATVHYLYADSTTREGLEKARVEHARVAVVLSDQRANLTVQDIDARTILTALAIERVNPAVHTIVELLSEENNFHVRNASVDEVIIAGQYLGSMLSQSVQFPGLSDVFGSMFGVGEGVMVREHATPADCADMSFAEAARYCSEQGLGALLGYRRGKDLKLTPPAKTPLALGDQLIVMRHVEG